MLIASIYLFAEDHDDRTPYKFQHNKMSFRSYDSKSWDMINGKFFNYSNKTYCLREYQDWDYHLNNYETSFALYVLDSENGSCVTISKSGPYCYSTSSRLFKYGNHAACFGYANYLWYFNKDDHGHNIFINKFDLTKQKLYTIKHSEMQGQESYDFTAACVMDTSILVFSAIKGHIKSDYYYYNSHTQCLEYVNSIDIGASEEGKTKFVASAETFMDTDSVLKIAYTTFNENDYVGELWYYNPSTSKSTKIWSKNNITDFKLAFGSMQGDAENKQYDSLQVTKDNPNRFTAFFVKKGEENHDGKMYNKRCPIGFVPFVYGDKGIQRMSPNECMLVLPSSDYYAKSKDDANIFVVYNYVSVDKSTSLPGNDGFQKQILIINSDKKNQSGYSYFNSDFYMQDPADPMPSSDFSVEYDSVNIRDYWILTGITDGAPPATINWDNWNKLHDIEDAPSELTLTSETSKFIETKTESQNSYGLSVSAKGILSITPAAELTEGVTYKNTKINESANDLSDEITVSISKSLELNKDSQKTATYFYLVPEITRYHFKVFPWWANGNDKCVVGSDRYMFKVIKYRVINEPVDLAIFPHNIRNANDTLMVDWVKRGNSNIDSTMAWWAKKYDIMPIPVNWTDGNPGDVVSLLKEDVTSIEQSHTTDSEFGYSSGFKIPDIFKISMESTYEISAKFTTSVETSMSNEIEISYENMVESKDGVNCKSLMVDAYLFTSKSGFDWWYYKNLPGKDKPWYIAYDVSLVSKQKVSLKHPAQNQLVYSDIDIQFLWESKANSSSLFIANSPNFFPEDIVYRSSYNKSKGFIMSSLPKGMYYWRVVVQNSDGALSMSEARSFEVVEKDFFKDNQLKTNDFPIKVYPNPVSGDELNINFELSKGSMVDLLIYNMQGVLMYKESLPYREKGIHTILLSTNNLNSSCFLLLQTNDCRSSVKILIK